MFSVRKKSHDRSPQQDPKIQNPGNGSARSRRHSAIYRDSLKNRRKVGEAAYTLMSPSLGLDPTLEYSRAEGLVDALVDLYGTIEGEWPTFGDQRHNENLVLRLRHLEKAVRSYRQAFETSGSES
jgi:hypothetical protein